MTREGPVDIPTLRIRALMILKYLITEMYWNCALICKGVVFVDIRMVNNRLENARLSSWAVSKPNTG